MRSHIQQRICCKVACVRTRMTVSLVDLLGMLSVPANLAMGTQSSMRAGRTSRAIRTLASAPSRERRTSSSEVATAMWCHMVAQDHFHLTLSPGVSRDKTPEAGHATPPTRAGIIPRQSSQNREVRYICTPAGACERLTFHSPVRCPSDAQVSGSSSCWKPLNSQGSPRPPSRKREEKGASTAHCRDGAAA